VDEMASLVGIRIVSSFFMVNNNTPSANLSELSQ
jgi:hypothetical protein